MAKTTKPEKKTASRAPKAKRSKAPAKKPAAGRLGGKPALFESAEALLEAITAYFDSLDDGENTKPPTMAGLAYALGFESRQSMYDYENRSEPYSYVVKRARLAIERHHESRLSGTTPTGSIFWLKNHAGYVDKSEVDMTTMTAEQRKKRLAALLAKAAQK